MSVLRLLVLLPIIAQACVDKYTEWTVFRDCSEDCGRCGTVEYKRDCEKGCQCAGVYFKLESCPRKLCPFPQEPCCNGFHKVLNMKKKKFECMTAGEKEEALAQRRRTKQDL